MSELTIHPLATDADTEACARLMAASDPWKTLGADLSAALRTMRDETRERYVAHRDGVLAGFLILHMTGTFSGYIQSVCLVPETRGHGLGTALIHFAEERIFRERPNVFLLVSSFNPDARRLYERLGYRVIGELPDFIVAGHSEILLRKTRGPLRGYRPPGSESG
jgi:ribosomal protein S18 acetylase RimI-like enzyme